MPAKPAQEPERTPAARTEEAASPAPETKTSTDEATADEVPEGRLPAGVYEFAGSVPTQYLEIPLTARPEVLAQDATDDTPAVAAAPATVFDWPFSAPDDGRWKPSKKKPNQQPDNAPADPEGE
ncbi:hypothetical protein AB0N99_30945 [Streptomyces sp. NPDC093272]|uniref:hypothetical protein n=1 Tax=Streptomyces sp. NPDC093272 TaxID=3154981 RepID=UPI00342ACC1F